MIWDEPKPLGSGTDGTLLTPDYSPTALQNMPEECNEKEWQIDSFANFVDRISAKAESYNPDLEILLFTYGIQRGYLVEQLAGIPNLDYFGCDGKPWVFKDLGTREIHGDMKKALLDQAPYFIESAHKKNKKALLLIENLTMMEWGFEIMEKRLPEIFSLAPECLMYYYYPRNVPNPERQMDIIAKTIKSI